MSNLRIISLILQTINKLLVIFFLVDILPLLSEKLAAVPGLWVGIL